MPRHQVERAHSKCTRGTDQIVPVTEAVTIGTPVPAPAPTSTGIRDLVELKRPDAKPTTSPARLNTGTVTDWA